MALRVRLGILGAHNAAFDQPANVRMIAGEARDSLAANQVQAAVPNMGETELAIDDRHRGTGRSHAVELRVFRGKTLNSLVSGREGLDQGFLRTRAKSVVVDAAHGLNRQPAGFLPTFVT